MTEPSEPPGGTSSAMRDGGPPEWLARIRHGGYLPYVVTSERNLKHLDTSPFGQPLQTFLMENPADHAFCNACIVSDRLGYGSRAIAMQKWVFVDFILMQTAAIGFMRAVDSLPAEFLANYATIRPTHVPITGQAATSGLGGELVGTTLFNAAHLIRKDRDPDDCSRGLGMFTKALAFEVLKAQGRWFYGVAQYQNQRAIRVHGRFSPRMEIYHPRVLLHTYTDMTFIYRMKLDFDPYRLSREPAPADPDFSFTFKMKVRDQECKKKMEERLTGSAFFIVPPYYDDQGLMLIREEARRDPRHL